MKKLIHSILKRFGFFKFRDYVTKKHARYFTRRNRKTIKGDGIMRVAFIVYEPGMWDKQKPVYEEMLKREDFEPFIIVAPDVSVSEETRKKKQAFFLENHKNVILYDNKTRNRFKLGEFQYTFYQTPYNYKFPKDIRPTKLVKYSKLCYIPYAYIGAEDFVEVSSQDNFFCNVYFGFMDSEPMQKILYNNFYKTCKYGYQNFEFLGYPAFESYLNLTVKDKIENILWLPRWSYAEKGGGSHFLEYKDNYNQLAINHSNLNWSIRPHTLMFTSLASLGLFSCTKEQEYRKNLSNAKVYLDEHSLLNETLACTDLVIADYSSIIVMYFLSGRPIIYCDGNLKLSGVYEQLYDAMYIAKSWDDVKELTEKLLNGIDPLRDKRNKISAQIADKHKNSAKKIVDRICEDYRNQNQINEEF